MNLHNGTQSKVISKLKQMVGVTVLDGWLDLYIKDFLCPTPLHTFPAVFVQYEEDNNVRQQNTPDNKCSRTLTVTGAVRVAADQNVNHQLDLLLLKVKASLVASDPTNSVVIPKVTFAVAETRDYALFNATVTITVTEKWEI